MQRLPDIATDCSGTDLIRTTYPVELCPNVPAGSRRIFPGDLRMVPRRALSGFIRTIQLLVLTVLLTLPAAGQGITDSIFAISEVAVTHTDNFRKEEAGMNRTTVDTLILQHQVHTDLSKLLAENTNIYIRDYGRGALATASFRGTAPSHTQVTWNGLNINSPMLGMVDLSLVPVFIIDELSIHHGAASVASRSGGLGGHVEMQSLPDWSNRAGGKIYMDYGSFGTAGGMAQIDLGSTKFQSKTRLYSSGSENDYPFVNKNIIEKDSTTGDLFHPVQQNRNAAYQKSGISQEFYFRPAKRSSRRRSSSPGSSPGFIHRRSSNAHSNPSAPADQINSTPGSDTPGTGSPEQSTLSPAGRAVISNRTWLQTADRSVPTVLSSEYQPGGLQRDNRQSDRTMKNVTEYNFYGELTKVQLRSGIDYQRLDYSMETEVVGLHRQKNVDSESRMLSWYNSGSLRHNFSERLSADAQAAFNRYGIATYDTVTRTGYDTVRLETSFFGGLYFSAVEQLQLSLQLRQDFVSDHTSPLIYTLGVNYRPLEKHDLVIRGNFARNYHHPTLNDMYWQPGGNPDLRPEEGYTGEVTVLWAAAAEGRSASTSLTGYYSRISDWILWLPGFKGYWEPVNLAEVRSYGLEYQLSAELAVRRTRLRLHGNVALSHTRDFSGIPGDREVDGGGMDGEVAAESGGTAGRGSAADGGSTANNGITVKRGTATNGAGALDSWNGTVAGTVEGTLEKVAEGTAEGAAADDGPGGEQLPFIPKISGNAFFSVMNRGWYLQWQYNAMGTRRLMSSGSGGPADDSDELLSLKGVERLTGSSDTERFLSSSGVEQLSGASGNGQFASSNGIRKMSGSSGDGQFLSSSGVEQLSGTSGTDRLYSLYPWFMNNLRIGKSFELPTQKITVECRIDNLFNETYRNELQRFMPGRSFTLHLKFDF